MEKSTRGVVPWSRSSTRTAPRFSRSPVTFQDQVDDGVEQRMARADESRQGCPGGETSGFSNTIPFVAGEDRLAGPDQPVAVPDQGRNVRHLVAARFTLAGRAAELPERLAEERLDVVRLQAARVGPLHLLAHALHAADVHRVVDELPLLEQVLQRRPVERMVDGGIEAGAHLRLLAIANGVEQQLAQRPPFELSLPSTSKTWPPSACRACSSFSSSRR